MASHTPADAEASGLHVVRPYSTDPHVAGSMPSGQLPSGSFRADAGRPISTPAPGRLNSNAFRSANASSEHIAQVCRERNDSPKEMSG